MRSVLPENARLVPAEAKLVFKGVIYDTFQWPQKMYDGTIETFEMLKRPDTVQVIAIKDNKIVVIEENQIGRGQFIGLPGGRHDRPSETELDAAKRELAEETGLVFNNWKLLAVMQPQSKIEHLIYHFLATDFEREVPRHLDAGETIKVTLKTFDQVIKLVDDPRTRNLAKDILTNVPTLEQLVNLPEFTNLR
jgi:ADP-ribose pyrophosphatase